MRPKLTLAAACVVLLLSIAARPAAQGPPPAQGAPPAGAPGQGAGRAGGGQGGGRANATFPAQQRPPGDPVLIERGKQIYSGTCRLCHGVDLRGGDMGGVNLLRSALVLADDHGELIYPVVRDGRQTPGMPIMPAQALPEADVKAVAEYIHSIVATSRGQGSPPAGPPVVLNVLVGDAAGGKAYFEQKCTSCHSATGDLAGLGTRISDPMQLQNAWVGGNGGRGRGGAAAAGPNRREVRVTVTPATGPKVEGRLDRIDDFLVVLTPADGPQRSFRRNGDIPKVEIKDPMAGHRALLSVYTDKDMHNVTAYLVTLK